MNNIEPIHPAEHRAQHRENGDFSRWAKRAGIAKAFGGRVERAAGLVSGRINRALGPIGVLPNITGVLTGRIRTDSFDNFTSDMIGVPSQEDLRRRFEKEQKAINPDWKPGDPTII